MSAAAAPWIAAQAIGLLTQRGHAWLLAGPSGLGQYDLALALASAWLCEQPSGQGACGHCSSCHAVSVRTHADLCVLMPEALMLALGWPLSEKVQAELDKLNESAPYEIEVEHDLKPGTYQAIRSGYVLEVGERSFKTKSGVRGTSRITLEVRPDRTVWAS